MRFCRLVLTAAIVALAGPFSASPVRAGPIVPPAFERTAAAWPIVPVAAAEETYDIDLIVGMSGKCAVFRIAGQNLPCRAVKYFHGESGRAYFTIAVDDPSDKGRIVSFSGDKARRDNNDFYELTIDQVLLNSRERPRVNSVRVPRVEPSNGTCKQFGDIESKQIKSISCVATDNGRQGLRTAVRGRRSARDGTEDHPGAAGVGQAPRKTPRAEGLPRQGGGVPNPGARQDGLHHPVPGAGWNFAGLGRSIGRCRGQPKDCIVCMTGPNCPGFDRALDARAAGDLAQQLGRSRPWSCLT